MRKLSDKGASANSRYENSRAVNGSQVATSQMIRLFANYNKCIRVENSMIRIEGKVNEKPERFWYTIWDDNIKYRYNGTQIRVRMVKDESSVIYLFDPKTDTYLGFLVRDYEPAGDLANQTKEDLVYMAKHSTKLVQDQESRKALKEMVIANLAATNNENDLHESITKPLLLTNKETVTKFEGENSQCNHESDSKDVETSNPGDSRGTDSTEPIPDLEIVAVEVQEDEEINEERYEKIGV